MKIFKKWWFWLIIIVAIAFLILGASESKKEEKINGSVISFVLQNSAFNDVSAQTDIKLSPEDSDSSVSNKAYAKTSYKAGTTLDTLKSEVKFVIADESIATVDEITFEAGSAENTMSTTCSFIPIADGTTTGHFENVDGSITSRDITITVSKMETVPLKALVGASLSDAISVVEKMSYTATYIHAQSGYDFTEEIKVFDNDQMAKYVITEVDKIDTDKKTVTLKINTQDNIDADTKAKKIEAALSSKLSAGYAWTAAADYGKAEYPYGFKLHYMAGQLAQEAVDEDTWYLKATCTVTNEYNATREMECEAKVTGTDSNPEVIEFNVH